MHNYDKQERISSHFCYCGALTVAAGAAFCLGSLVGWEWLAFTVPGIIAAVDNHIHGRDNNLDDGGKNYVRAAVATALTIGASAIGPVRAMITEGIGPTSPATVGAVWPAGALVAGGVVLGIGLAMKARNR